MTGGVAVLGGTAGNARGLSPSLDDCGPATHLPARAHSGRLSFSFAYAPRPLRSGDPVVWVIRVVNPSDWSWRLVFPTSLEADVLLSWPTAPRLDGSDLVPTRRVAYAWSIGHGSNLQTEAIRQIPPRTSFTCILRDVLYVKPGRYKLLALLTLKEQGPPFYVRRTVEVSPSCGGRPCE